VQRRQHEVARERGLDRDAGGLGVADLADEDDVGVLAEDRPEALGEGDAGDLVDLDLVDRGEDVLHRVLDGHDVALAAVDLAEGGVERRRLAAAGGADADHHPEGRADELAPGLVGVGRHAEVGALEQGPALVEEAHRDLLAEDCRRRRHPDVEGATVDLERRLAVLGPAPLDDVHAGHDLDPADQGRAHLDREGGDVVEGAVDPEADPELVVLGLEVDVGGPVAQRLGDHQVDHLHHGRLGVGDGACGRLRCGGRVAATASPAANALTCDSIATSER